MFSDSLLAMLPPNTLYSFAGEKFFKHNGLVGELKISDETFEELKKYDLIIADYSGEHWGYSEGVMPEYHQLKSTGLNFIFLTHHDADHLLEPNYLFFPHHHFNGHNTGIIPQFESIKKLSKKYKVSCLNRNPRAHRLYNYFKLKEKSYFPEMLFTMHNEAHHVRGDDPKIDQSIIDEWERIRHIFPIGSKLGGKNAGNTHPSYLDTYVHLVTETTVLPKIFITEKTWKPIASGNLFIVLGNPGIIQHLRNSGVDVFDDYVNHDYDNETGWEKRVEKIHKLVDHFMSMDESELLRINTETQARRLANMRKFFAGEFISKYINCFLDKVNELTPNKNV